MTLITVDPGKSRFAWAKFVEGVLSSCGETPTSAIEGWQASCGEAQEVVIELPQVYRAVKLRGDPNDLVAVAVTVGQISYALRRANVRLVLPHEWKGSVEKSAMLRRIERKLSLWERTAIDCCGVPRSRRHNVLDAVGLGLYHLARLLGPTR